MSYLKKFSTVDDFTIFKNSNEFIKPNVSLIVETKQVKYHKAQYHYYDSLDVAINDINQNEIGLNAQDEKNSMTVCNISQDGKLNITLYADTIITQTLSPTCNLNLKLNGKTIISNCDTFLITNYGVIMQNGEIICNPLSNLSESYCALLNGGESYVDGMKFQINTNGGGEHENPSTTLKITSNGVLNVSNSIFKGVDNVNGSISNIYVDENCLLNGKDCNFEIISPNGMSSNVFSKGNICLENCNLQCYANHTANEAGTYYATMSRAIYSLIGNVTLKDCIIYGTHSGLTIRNGELYIDGGTYDGYSHGGIYLGNANQKSYIYNASINDVALRGEGMYDDGVAGTNHAAMYIGGANFMQVYVDNCEFYGKIQPIVIKYNATSSHDNHLYISNSRMNLDYTRSGIRNDGANYVTFGINNNFDYLNLENNRNYEITNENYFIR